MPDDHSPTTAAVLVTYHPDAGLPERIVPILAQVARLILVDNGSGEGARTMLLTLAADPKVEVILNGANLGIARAFNLGVARAAAHGARFVLLLDQDSQVMIDMVSRLFAARASFPHTEDVAVVGSGFRDIHKGMLGDSGLALETARDERPSTDEALAAPWELVQYVISSGSLIDLSLHARIGPFREELFIDQVDIDYCLRARALGLHVIKTRQPLMLHAIGRAVRHRLLWKTKWMSHHSAERRYYFVRNDTVMLRDYGGFAHGLWAWHSLARAVRLCKNILLYEQGKAAKVRAVMQGWWHGVRGRLGPRRPIVAAAGSAGPDNAGSPRRDESVRR